MITLVSNYFTLFAKLQAQGAILKLSTFGASSRATSQASCGLFASTVHTLPLATQVQFAAWIVTVCFLTLCLAV
jgi:hypothetical protein